MSNNTSSPPLTASTGSPGAPLERMSGNQSSDPPSSIHHFSAHIIGFVHQDSQVMLEPTRGDFTMLIGPSCANFDAIHAEAWRIIHSGSGEKIIRMSFDTAPENFSRLDVVPRGSREYEEDEDEEAPSRSRVERQAAAASGQGVGSLRRLTVLNGETESGHQSESSGQGRFDGETRRPG